MAPALERSSHSSVLLHRRLEG